MTTRTPITFRGGRLPADPDRPHLLYAALLHDEQAPPPESSDWLTPVPVQAWGMLGNDTAGDCTCAGIAHKLIGDVYVGQDGTILAITTAQTLGLYSAITGYDPADPGTDRGALCQQVLEYVRRHGFAGQTVVAFARVDVRDLDQVKRAIATFGQVYAGFDVPASAEQQFNDGEDWSVVAGSPVLGGHCVTLGAYDADGPSAVTWGAVQRMSWEFFQEYFEEVWVVLSPDMIDPVSGLDHLGLSLAALEAAFTELTGQALRAFQESDSLCHESAMPQPSVGRMVHYVSYGTPGGEYTSQCRAATITQVNEDGTVGLAVLNPTGMAFNVSIMGDFTERQGGTWHWPERV